MSRSSATLVVLCLFLALPAPAQAPARPLLIGYWHNWGNSPNSLTLAQVPSEYDVINASFAVPSVPGGASMVFAPDPQLYPQAAAFDGDLQALRAQGRKVLISIGGANGPVHLDTAADQAAFVSSMLGILAAHAFDGLDIDLEGSSLLLAAGDFDFRTPTSPRVVNFIAAINQILAAQPPGFLLTAAPETATLQGAAAAYGGVWGAYLPVIHALRNDLDWVQTQHYNTGSMFGRDGQIYLPATADFHVAMADMLISGFFVPAAGATFAPLRADQVVIGLPASTSAAGSGFTAAGPVQDAVDNLALGLGYGGSYQQGTPAGHRDFRGLMTWSINWDVAAGQAFSLPHRAHLDALELGVDRSVVSYSQGGPVHFGLRAGPARAGRLYYLVPTLSGTWPGTWLPGNRYFPINLDPVSQWPFQAGTAAYFPGFLGLLDANGSATATMNVPPTPGVAPFGSHFAFIVDWPWDFFSRPVAVDFLP
ncbi:MAG: chitinase [Planctomycetes bacterium]|nr:chitinase [Planctomycetota bacterium]